MTYQSTNGSMTILTLLRELYEKQGEMFTLSDLLIASTAIENDLTLIIGNCHPDINGLKRFLQFTNEIVDVFIMLFTHLYLEDKVKLKYNHRHGREIGLSHRVLDPVLAVYV